MLQEDKKKPRKTFVYKEFRSCVFVWLINYKVNNLWKTFEFLSGDQRSFRFCGSEETSAGTKPKFSNQSAVCVVRINTRLAPCM